MNVPCIMIDDENFIKWWSYIKKCLKETDFLAIDLELSGLGSKDIFSSQIDERYKAIRQAALTRTILSMGIACFKINYSMGFFKNKKHNKDDDDPEFIIDQIVDCLENDDEILLNHLNNKLNNQDDKDQSNDNDDDNNNFYIKSNVFHFLTLNSEKFLVETRSMKFLLQQGFDFNELILKGIPFNSGNDSVINNDDDNDKENNLNNDDNDEPSLRNLIEFIISLKLPILLHNGIIDIIFLYQNFYTELPKTLEQFLADLTQIFPMGIYDTKYIASSSSNQSINSSSYLEYLFQQTQRLNYFRQLKNLNYLLIEFDINDDNGNDQDDVRMYDLSAKIMKYNNVDEKICDSYSKYGWCEKSDHCKQSHNIDLILDEELLLSKKNLKTKQLIEILLQKQKEEELNENQDNAYHHRKFGLHHAGNDAFMTGYYFLFNLFINNNKINNDKSSKNKLSLNHHPIMKRFKNKIFLSSKPRPLNIMKSLYTDYSMGHCKKFEKIRKKFNL